MTALSRILLVEDDPADVRLALAVFEELQLSDQVFTVVDGVEALDYLYHRSKYRDRLPGYPAVTFLDLKLPRVNGLEVLAAMRADPLLKNIPVVCLTSSREDRDLHAAYDLGVNGYVVKRIDYDEYRTALKAAVLFWATANESPPGCLTRPRARDGLSGSALKPKPL